MNTDIAPPRRTVRRSLLPTVLLTVLLAALPAVGACTGGGSDSRSHRTGSQSAGHSSAPDRTPRTGPPPDGGQQHAPDGHRRAGPRRGAAPSSPEAVVRAYFRALNQRDYRTAWRLGGSNLGQSYGAFVRGFQGTEHDTITINDTYDNTVAVHLVAVQTDGSTRSYSGVYTVSDNEIASAHVVQAPGGDEGLCGAPNNPHDYNFCGRGGLIYRPGADFCVIFDCIDNFDQGTGYVVQCGDDMFSHSGGRPGVCSYHEGRKRNLYGPG